jgi:hypothetical protein
MQALSCVLNVYYFVLLMADATAREASVMAAFAFCLW